MVGSKRSDDRKEEILEMICRDNRVYVAELSEHFEVSEVTIRKDLQELEQRGVTKRVHGGAINIYNTGVEPTLIELEQTNIETKRVIAEAAFDCIKNHDVIFMDASSTGREMLPFICRHPEKELTIITSSLLTAADLANVAHVSVFMLGGGVRGTMRCVEGAYAINFVRQFHADKVFIGTNGFDVNGGITITNVNESLLKREMIENSTQAYLLADSSKYNCIAMGRVCPLNRIDFLITDDQFNAKDVSVIEQQGVEVIIAKKKNV